MLHTNQNRSGGKTQTLRSSRSWPRGKLAQFCVSCYSLETLYLLGLKEISIWQKFNNWHYLKQTNKQINDPCFRRFRRNARHSGNLFTLGNLIVWFECKRQMKDSAQSLECPLTLTATQSLCCRQLCSLAVLTEVQWPQQTSATQVFFCFETAT